MGKLIKIEIKPLSANNAWRGRRFKTKEYKKYTNDLLYILPNLKVPKGKLKVYYEFGLSNKGADGDNCVKQFQDIISNKYDFNDNKIYKWSIKKVDVEKGEEYIMFRIEKFKK